MQCRFQLKKKEVEFVIFERQTKVIYSFVINHTQHLSFQ